MLYVVRRAVGPCTCDSPHSFVWAFVMCLQSFEATYTKMQAIDSQWKRDAAQEKRWKQAEVRAVQQRKDADKQAAEQEAARIEKEKAGASVAVGPCAGVMSPDTNFH